MGKQLHNRAMRRHVKATLQSFINQGCSDTDELYFKHPYEITNPYDICDWWFWAEDDPKAYRK